MSLDYLAREAEIALGSCSDEESEGRIYRKSLPETLLPTIEELGAGWDFHPDQQDLSWWGLGESGD